MSLLFRARLFGTVTKSLGSLPLPGADVQSPALETISKRRLFRQTKVDHQILRRIDSLNAGRRRVKGQRLAKEDLRLRHTMAPMLFGQMRPKLKFMFAAEEPSSLEPSTTNALPEIAFAGRSNCGKSSLINALAGQGGVARVSSKPGLTQTINFYSLGSPPLLSLVDLPGYGFAFAKSEKREGWTDLTRMYLTTRKSLKRVFVLLDGRHGLKVNDREFLSFLDSNKVRFQVVLTKTDLVLPLDLGRRLALLNSELGAFRAAVAPVLLTSSRLLTGMEELRQHVQRLVPWQTRATPLDV